MNELLCEHCLKKPITTHFNCKFCSATWAVCQQCWEILKERESKWSVYLPGGAYHDKVEWFVMKAIEKGRDL